MSVMPSKFSAKFPASTLIRLSILGVAFAACSAWAQAPSVVVDAQQIIGTGFNNPQSVAVSKNGTIFVADTNNNRIVALTPNPPGTGTNNIVTITPSTIVLSSPQALALDAAGDLFVGDMPSSGVGRIVKLNGDGTGNLTGAGSIYFSGSPLTDPISLAVDSTGTLFIGDYPVSTGKGAIYTTASAGATPQLLAVTGLSTQLTPAALLRVSTNLYIADNGNGLGSIGGVYVVPATGGAAQLVATQSFVVNQPSGLAVDTAGDLYILSMLGLTGSVYNSGQQVLVIPAASPTTPYILPNTKLNTSTSMAFDPLGNLDIVELLAGNAGDVAQLAYISPVNLGNITLGQAGQQVSFNFEFNQPTTLNGFRVITQSDTSQEVIQALGGTCPNGKIKTLPNGGPAISPYFPYTCAQAFYGDPTFPGIRSSAIQLKGSAGSILASTAVYETGLGGVETTYPLNASATAGGLQQPQAVVVSGLNRKVYVADTLAGIVYFTNGVGGKTITPVSTGAITLQAPTALALDGAGNLFIGDFNLGEVVEVPQTTGAAASVVNTGGLLQHPIAMTSDYAGNLYIGDAGPAGIEAGSGNPGYVVKVPVGGTPFKMTIPSVSIIFPQALASDPNTHALWIGDGGDPSSVGQIVELSADGSTAAVVPLDGVTNPTGLVFDPAEDLYVLDGTANTITAVPPSSTGVAPYLVGFNNALLASASALGVSAGGQSFIIGNIGAGSSNSLVYVDGNRSTLLFGNVKVGSQSPPQTATEYNIGNASLTLGTPYYTTNTPNPAFSVLNSSTCTNGLVLAASHSCTLNIEFTPGFIGQTSQQITVDSNAYNVGAPSGAPFLLVKGTGHP